MGLHAVSAFLKKKHSHLYHKEHLSLFAHQRVYMDITGYLYKYVVVYGTDTPRWLNSMFNLFLQFRKNCVHLIPVFDGKAPDAKLQEQQDRRESRKKQQARKDQLDSSLARYEQNIASQEDKLVIQKELATIKRKQQRSLLTKSSKSADGSENNSEEEEENDQAPQNETNITLSTQDIFDLKQLIKSIEKQTSFLTNEDHQLLRDLMDAVGMTWIQAPSESEAYCCWLVRNGHGTAVVSYDTDCIAHRADIIIFDVDTNTGMLGYVNTEEIMQEWKLTEYQLIDFGILVGCDYNPNSRVNKIGPVGAIKLLQKHQTIEHIPNLKDITVLKHELCRQLFDPQYPTDVCIKSADCSDAQKMREAVNKIIAGRQGIQVHIFYEIIQINCKKLPIKIHH
jgi:flap endonuclease-1